MIRTSFLCVALLALAAPAVRAGGPENGFRVYTVGLRCGQRTLASVHNDANATLRKAEELRKKGSKVEVTTGLGCKTVPTGKPELFVIYSQRCAKSGWQRREVASDAKKAEQIAATHTKDGETAMIVHDYKPGTVARQGASK